MLEKIDHIGILVDDIETHLEPYTALGLPVGTIEHVPAFGVDIAFLPVGESLVELIEPTDPEGAIMAELTAATAPGILHHIAFRVTDIETRLADLKANDIPLADEHPRTGAGDAKVAFLADEACYGVRIELVDRPADLTFE